VTGRHVLFVRQDNAGDVVLQGPAIRAVAASATTARVTLVSAPQGEAAARLLPGVGRVVVHPAPWIDAHPRDVDRRAELAFVDDIAALGVDEAIVSTSFHQSPLPTALLLRLAGVDRIGATCDDYPGALLDVRHRVDDEVHEVERALSLVAAMGHALPPDDDARLALALDPSPSALAPSEPYVVVHPGASGPARAWHPAPAAATVRLLVDDGWTVVLTGTPGERGADPHQIGADGRRVRSAVGHTDLADLARLIRGAAALVVGNTGPAHVAAAVGTPVVSLFAPTVPAARWRPWMVPHVLLGDQDIACAGCRARRCPHGDVQPCLAGVTPDDVVGAVRRLAPARQAVAS
jgi:ADP-heptose:LPS heptosyltransferase